MVIMVLMMRGVVVAGSRESNGGCGRSADVNMR